MIANSMLVFWITINLADLRYPLVICFASIELELLSNIRSIFWHKTVTINPIPVAKLFYIICDTIFMSLFGTGQIEGRLLGPILNYFDIIETNSCKMLHLHCLVWLKSVLHLATL